jgi:hypothetical protein
MGSWVKIWTRRHCRGLWLNKAVRLTPALSENTTIMGKTNKSRLGPHQRNLPILSVRRCQYQPFFFLIETTRGRFENSTHIWLRQIWWPSRAIYGNNWAIKTKNPLMISIVDKRYDMMLKCFNFIVNFQRRSPKSKSNFSEAWETADLTSYF